MMKLKRNKIEQMLIDAHMNDGKAKAITADSIKIIILKMFFEIYDVMESTSHLICFIRLYFSRDSAFVTLEKVAQDTYSDISTLRRNRRKYRKAILYVFSAPVGSYVRAFMRLISHESKF